MSNPRIKSIAGLAMKKERAESALFVVEGLQLVGFGVEAGWELVTLVFSSNMKPAKKGVMEALQDAASEVLEVNAEVMEKISRKDNPPGVVGVFKQRSVALKDAKVSDVWVVLEEVRDPGNLGTIIRTVDAAGAGGVILVGNCTDVWAPESVRATMGSIFHVPVVVAPNREKFMGWLKAFGGAIVGTQLEADTDYRQLPPARPMLLVMGTEQSGLSEELSAACTTRVKIPMAGKAESLNLSIATGLLIYEARRSVL